MGKTGIPFFAYHTAAACISGFVAGSAAALSLPFWPTTRKAYSLALSSDVPNRPATRAKKLHLWSHQEQIVSPVFLSIIRLLCSHFGHGLPIHGSSARGSRSLIIIATSAAVNSLIGRLSGAEAISCCGAN